MSKIQCPNCLGFTREKTFKYHKCDKSIPREVTISAWAGDPLHRSDTIAFLSSLGYDSSVSHTFLVSYVSAEHQAAYLDAYSLVPPEHRQLNEHNRAQLFEASYFDDPAFRSLYKSRVFGTSTCCIEVTSTPEEYGRFALKNPVPFPVVHVKPRRQVKVLAVARPFLGAALMFFFSYFFSLVLSFILLSYFGNSHTVRWFLFKNFHIL